MVSTISGVDFSTTPARALLWLLCSRHEFYLVATWAVAGQVREE